LTSAVAAALVDHVAGQAGDEDFRLVGDALAAVVVDAEELGMQHPQVAVLVDHAARVVHLGEGGDLVHLAVAVLIDAAQHLAAAGGAADRPLLIDGDEQFAGRRRRQRHRVVHLRRGGEQRHVEAVGRLDAVAEGALVDGLGRPAAGAAAAAGRRPEAEAGGDVALALAGQLRRDRGGALLGERRQLGRLRCRGARRAEGGRALLARLGRLLLLRQRLLRHLLDRLDLFQQRVLGERLFGQFLE
jgi:hypothetical protein